MRKRKPFQDDVFRCSRELFLQKGYDAVSIDEVCAAVGISKPTFYSAKLAKADLLIACYQLDEKALDDIQRRLGKQDPLDTIHEICDLLFSTLTGNTIDMLGSLYQIALAEHLCGLLVTDRWKQILCEAIDQAQKQQKILNMVSARILTDMVGAGVVGYFKQLILRQMEPDRDVYHRVLHALLRVPIGVEL